METDSITGRTIFGNNQFDDTDDILLQSCLTKEYLLVMTIGHYTTPMYAFFKIL